MADQALVAFYHPWSDTALITAWADQDKPRIYDCEILMGDVFRTRGSQRPVTTRAWARRQQYFAASIAHMSAISMRSLELLSYPSNTSAANTIPHTWRNHIPFLLDTEALEANHVGAGILMLSAISDVARYAAPTNVFAIRVLPALHLLHSKTNAIKMTPEARQVLQGVPENYMDYYVPAFYANSAMRAFLLLQAKQDPKRCLALLFGLEAPEEEDEKSASLDTALTNKETFIDYTDEEISPVSHYSLKLLRLDLLNLQAAHTNLYPQKK
jgi:hypothetical protein